MQKGYASNISKEQISMEMGTLYKALEYPILLRWNVMHITVPNLF